MTDLHSSVCLILIYTYDNIYILRLVYIGGEIYVLIIYLCECRYDIGVYRWPFPNQGEGLVHQYDNKARPYLRYQNLSRRSVSYICL